MYSSDMFTLIHYCCSVASLSDKMAYTSVYSTQFAHHFNYVTRSTWCDGRAIDVFGF